MGVGSTAKSLRWNRFKISKALVRGYAPAKEITAVPVDADMGHHGAIALFAVLAYPGTDVRAHAQRDRFMDAVLDWIAGWRKYHRLGYQRITARRSARAAEAGVRRQVMKNAAVYRALNRAEGIIIERRLLAARTAEHLAGVWGFDEFNKAQSRIRLKVSGPQSISAAISYLAEQTTSGDASTLWRIWRESLPVLHLACAFDKLQPPRQAGDRPDLVVRCVRDHRLWVAETVRSAEARALMLPHYTNFDPAQRIALVAE